MMAELPKIIHTLGGHAMIALDSEKELDKEWVELLNVALELRISYEEIRNFLHKKLDKEWMELIIVALESGIPYEEIRNFLHK